MPELPEMETYRSLLQQKIGGQTITNVFINREKSINMPTADFSRQVRNQKIESIDRRAKYLIFRLQNGSCLLLHLMLGGWMFYGKEEEKPNRTVQVQFSFGERHLYFIGLRLGYLHLLSRESLEEELQNIGPEPLNSNFSLDTFLSTLKGRRGGLKTTLINQECIAGIGNRYSDEILWHAQILPDKKIHNLNHNYNARLYESIRFTLMQAIKHGGYMSEPLFHGDSKTGGYNNMMYVHDQEGKPCKRCGSSIVKSQISSRKTFYCRNCQH